MKFQVSFDVSNDAFDESPRGGSNPCPYEISQILDDVSYYLRHGHLTDTLEGLREGLAIKDRNGNRIGRWSLID